jgi:hypothetical protein
MGDSMSSKIKAGTSSSGVVLDADNTGILELQSGSTPTTAVTVNTAQDVLVGGTTAIDGGVGVQVGGTSAGNAKSTLQLLGNTNSWVQFGNGLSGASRYLGWVQYNYASNYMTFATDSTERMRIDSSGNVLVNATSSTGHKMTVQSAAGAGGIDCVGGATNGYYAMRVDMPSTNTYGVLFRNNGNNVGDIRVNSSTTTYNTSSDYRLKENIAPMTGALNKVSQLKPVTYKWKATGEESQGFIAHELQAVVPDCVTGEKDAVDAEGNPQYQGIDTSFLVATLTAAIQEQQAMITTLQTQVAALQEKVGV